MSGSPDATLIEWAALALSHSGRAPAEVAAATGLRDGGSPWLLELTGAEVKYAILRVGSTTEPGEIRTEVEALEYAIRHGIPVPTPYGWRDTEPPSLLLMEHIVGSSEISPRPDPVRLRALGALGAQLHCTPVPPWGKRRVHTIADVDFDELRLASPRVDVMERAAGAVSAIATGIRTLDSEPDGFVHGDLWHGNTMWLGEVLVAVIDWDCAGYGSAGVDLGSLRLDAALAHGEDAAREVLNGWEAAAGRTASNLAYWDLVAGLSSPPDMGWFTATTKAQGRPDLTQELMVRRRNEFLEDGLARLAAAGSN